MEAEWADKCHVPTFDEYVLNGLVTGAYGVIMAASFLGLEEVAGVEEYDVKYTVCICVSMHTQVFL